MFKLVIIQLQIHAPNDNLIKQLDEIREIKHKLFTNDKKNINLNNDNNVSDNGLINPVQKWPNNTLLCVSDSIMINIDEKRLSRKFNTKVRCFSGATVDDMFDYITPLLKKEPDHILLHTGTNNCNFNTSDVILTKILNLKKHIETILPKATVIISQPIVRIDDAKASLTVRHLIDKVKMLDCKILDNSNINYDHLGNKGLHLNGRGTGRLAMNIISLMRQL